MKLEELEELVLEWAEQKGILANGTSMKQGLKTLEECTELLNAIQDNNRHEIMDAIGDILVTLIIQSEMHGMKIEECLESAYNVIKNRKGRMFNGQFYKEV